MEQVGFPAAELSNRGGSFSFLCILSMWILRRLSPSEVEGGCSAASTILIGVKLMEMIYKKVIRGSFGTKLVFVIGIFLLLVHIIVT
jgi:hypothetical protein